jgi:hypothetical protein
MKTIITSLFIFFLFQSVYCQQNNYVQQVLDEQFSTIEIPVLTKSQMYADFDTLSYLIKYVYPYYSVKEQLSNANYSEELAKLRSQIANVEQPEDFIWILQKALILVHDGHVSIAHPDIIGYAIRENNKTDLGFKITPENIVCSYKYYLLTHDSLNSKIKIGMRFKYLDGKYYSYRPFKYKNQIYPEGLLLKSINGMSIDSYINQYHAGMRGVGYDYKNKKYFGDFFFISPDFLNQRTHILVFEDDKKNILQDTFYVDVPVENLSQKREPQTNEPAVFTVQDSILYIRMPYMWGDEDFYTQEIHKLYNEKIQKIVIDVRSNGGGADMFWKNILSHIISDTLRQDIALYAPNPIKEINDFLLKRNKADQTDYLPLLNRELTRIYKNQEKIPPHENSIGFKGKIVLMQDEDSFSAAGSLLATAKGNEQITSIGYNMGSIGGRGLGPLLFELPNTKMLVRIAFVIDYSGINEITDFLKNVFPEIECESSFDTFLRNLKSTNPYQADLLLQDECFLQAMTL